jgi:alpha-aminoadipate carrier protein LysW
MPHHDAEEMNEMNDCPICGCDIMNEEAELCELIPCPDCGSDLEVTSMEPFTLEAAPEEQEDWGE